MVWGKDVLCPVRRSIPRSSAGTRLLVRSSPGRSLREIGRELGVNHETLRNWVNAAKRAEQKAGRRDPGEELTASEREELRRLRKKLVEVELERLSPSHR